MPHSPVAAPWIEGIEGVTNARDFGHGMTGADGRAVRGGLLMRTAHLAAISDAGRARLTALGVRTIVDLRRAVERELQPNRLDGLGLAIIQSDLSERDGNTLPPHLQYLLEAELTAQATHDWMVTSYGQYPWYPQHQEAFAAAFRALADTEGGLVVHCAAGKDRTGVLCGLILSALGVDDDAIEADYLRTNEQAGFETLTTEFADRFAERWGRRVPPEALLPMVGVHRDFLRAAWTAIDTRHGDRIAYLASIGIGADTLERVRHRLLA